MSITRRRFLAGGLAMAMVGPRVLHDDGGGSEMYGLIGKIEVVPGQRDALVEILLEGISGMPGCLSYVVATDPDDENGIWVTEVWENRESHQHSLTLPSVQEAIRKGRELIRGFDTQIETVPVGGHGL